MAHMCHLLGPCPPWASHLLDHLQQQQQQEGAAVLEGVTGRIHLPLLCLQGTQVGLAAIPETPQP